jgi:hypothetical protein
MSADDARIELQIDVFDLAAQRALALSTLTPPQLVAAVLEEFRELEFLGADPAGYQLLKAADHSPLDDGAAVGDQLGGGDRLILVERVTPPPPGAGPPSKPVYLREQTSGKVFRLDWQPAIIGRPDRGQEHNELVAVDLAGHPAGQRVSRRHAQIVESDGVFFVEPLSPNPTVVRDGQGNAFPAQKRQPLRHGDVVFLENSQIALKFIVRDGRA